MGKRGPARTPTKTLKLRGSYKALRREETEATPVLDTQIHKPQQLKDKAALAWRRLAPKLRDTGLLTIVDRDALARYCELLARWRDCQDFIDKHGMTHPVKDAAGNLSCLREFPQVGRSARLADQLLALEKQFGMTPSARSSIEVDESFINRNDKPTVESFQLVNSRRNA